MGMYAPAAGEVREKSGGRTGLALATPATLVLLGVLLCLALAVRLYALTSYGIWFDEAYHVALVREPTAGAMLDAVLSNPPSDPLYVLLLRGWVDLLGHGDATIRLLSVIISTGTVAATYWLGRVIANRWVGLLAALFLAVSPYAVELGQEAALYSLASLTTTLTLAAGFRWLREVSGMDQARAATEDPRPRGYATVAGRSSIALPYILLGVVAIYSHYVVAVILGLFGLAGVLVLARDGREKRALAVWVVAHLIILAAWLPWLVALAVHWLDSSLPRVSLGHTATWGEVGGALVQFTSGTSSLLQGKRLLAALGLLPGGAMLIGALLWPSRERRSTLTMLAISTLVFLPPAFVSMATGLWLFVPHFMIFLLPALFVALASGALGCGLQVTRWLYHMRVQRPQLTIGNGVSLLLIGGWLAAQVWGLALFYGYPPHGNDGLRELAGVLRSQARPDDIVLVTPPILMPTLRQYYEGPAGTRGLPSDFDLRAIYAPYADKDWNLHVQQAFDRLATGHTRLWLVYRSEQDVGGAFLHSVQAHYTTVQHDRYEFADLYLFSR